MAKISKIQLPGLLILLFGFLIAANAAPDRSVKIIGGEPAIPGEFPFMVSIQYRFGGDENNHVCGGTLVSPSRVVTSAHCLDYPTGIDKIYVVAGAHLIQEAVKGVQQSRQVKKVTLHPNYNSSNIHSHNLALIDLKTPFDESVTVKTIPYASEGQRYTEACQILGWGYTDENDLELSDELRKANLTINSVAQCEKAFPTQFDKNYQICAGGLNENVGSCDGDDGGPLICTTDSGNKYFVGINTYSVFCGGPERPGVYMAIAKYRTWLDSVATGNENSGASTPSAPTTTRKTINKPEPEVPEYADPPKDDQNQESEERINDQLDQNGSDEPKEAMSRPEKEHKCRSHI